jgi:hypothetical protein
MPLGSTVHSSNIINFKTIYYAHFQCYKICKFWGRGATLPTVGRFSLHQENRQNYDWTQKFMQPSSETIADSTRSMPIYTLISFTKFMIKIREVLKLIHLYTKLTQEQSSIFDDQMPNCLVLKKVYFMLVSKFSTVYDAVWRSSRITRQNLKQL